MARYAVFQLGAGARVRGASPWCVAAVALAAAGPPAFAKHEHAGIGAGIAQTRSKGNSHGDGDACASCASFAAGASVVDPDDGEETWVGVAPAPYLRLYFDAVTRATTEFYQSMVETGSTRRGLRKVRAALDEARPLLERSFRHHDADGDGVLDEEEARAFFSHVVSEEGGLIEAVYTGVTMKYMQKVILEADDDGACEAMQSIGAHQAMLREKLEGNVQHYLQNKDRHDEAAFAVCDVNRSGTLELSEVVNALDPLHPRNDLFAQALGFKKEYKDLAATYVDIERAAVVGHGLPALAGAPPEAWLRARVAVAAAAGGVAVMGILLQRGRRCE